METGDTCGPVICTIIRLLCVLVIVPEAICFCNFCYHGDGSDWRHACFTAIRIIIRLLFVNGDGCTKYHGHTHYYQQLIGYVVYLLLVLPW